MSPKCYLLQKTDDYWSNFEDIGEFSMPNFVTVLQKSYSFTDGTASAQWKEQPVSTNHLLPFVDLHYNEILLDNSNNQSKHSI